MSKTKAGPIGAERLKSFIERIEKLREEKKAIASDERDVFAEAFGVGYDKKAMREVLKRRQMDGADRDEWDALIDTYEHALGARGVAAREVAAGATYEEAAARANVSRATVARSVASRKNLECETPKGEEAEASTPGAALPLGSAESQATPDSSTQPDIGKDDDDVVRLAAATMALPIKSAAAVVAVLEAVTDKDGLTIPDFLRRTERVRA